MSIWKKMQLKAEVVKKMLIFLLLFVHFLTQNQFNWFMAKKLNFTFKLTMHI